MSGGIFGKCSSILFKTRIDVFPTRHLLNFFCVVLMKKLIFCSWGELVLTQNKIIKVPLIFSIFSFWEGSVKRNSIIMICKEYHYVINLGIASIFFYQYRPYLSWILCQRIYHSRWTQRNLGSLFFIDPLAHCPEWVLTGCN